MGRHRPADRHTPTATDLIAQLSATNPSADADTAEIPALARVLPAVPPRLRWAAGLTAAGLAASGLVGSDSPPADAAAVEPVAASIPISEPPTAEMVTQRLGELAASRATRDQATSDAQAVQDAAVQATLDQRAAVERVAARQRAALEAAQRTQEAASNPAPSSATPHPSQAAEDVTETPGVASTSTGINSIVPGARLTSGFEMRWGVMHWGIDLAAPLGTPIYSPVSGRVLLAGPASGFGNWVVIIDGNGDAWVFGHMRVMTVSVGDHVSVGDQIAKVGQEGQSTGPHCHIERHVGGLNGSKVDPSGALGL